jgi:metallo-beta-lactamase family protein
MKLSFLGGAGEVTGSQHLLETEQARVLFDCGLFQGDEAEMQSRNSRFRCRPGKLDAVILSHAHIDHCGNLPGLVRAGYNGPIYCTPPTADIAAIMLRDSARIQEEDARYTARKRRGEAGGIGSGADSRPLYTEDDAWRAIREFEPVEFHTWFDVAAGVRARFLHAGHVLGAAITELEVQDGGEVRRLVFSGDLGRRNQPLLEDPELIERCDVLICESTYGDRIHPETSDVKAELGRVICEAAARGGRVIIPAFSLGRTQMLVYLLNELRNSESMCRVPVFIDSPLATRLTEVHRAHTDDMDADVQRALKSDDDIFDFPGLTYVRSQDESMALNRMDGPRVVISAGGMCENGRVVHHLKHAVTDDRNTVLIIGFQAAHTLGRRLVERRPELRILGRTLPLRARVEVLNGLSAHADAEDFAWWFGALQRSGGVGRVFLVHGEAKAAQALAKIAEDAADEGVTIPQLGDSFEV